MKRLYLSDTNKKIGGVCGGLGEYFEVDPTVIRLGFVLLMFATGIVPLLLAYFISYFIIPPGPSSKPVKDRADSPTA